jgi:hypothetical protein
MVRFRASAVKVMETAYRYDMGIPKASIMLSRVRAAW